MKYRKKPVVIEAVQFTRENLEEVRRFLGESNGKCEFITDYLEYFLEITTLEGIMTAIEGDYIIKGVQGEFYPCKPDIFEATYEKVE